MDSKLTAFIVCNADVLWESIDSCRAFCDHVVVCDIGMDDIALSIVDEYRSIKGGVQVMTYDNVNEVCMNLDLDGWNLVIHGNEVVHEESCHYLWDISRNHPEFDGIRLKVVNIISGHGKWTAFELEDTRVFRGPVSNHVTNNGTVFSLTGCRQNFAPAGLCPRPLYGFSFSHECNGSSNFDALSAVVPRSARRLCGRVAYNNPYLLQVTR